MGTTDNRTTLKRPRGIFASVALRSLRSNRTHTAVSIVGIALSCALITAIFTSVATMYQGLLGAELGRDGAWQVRISDADAGGRTDIAGDERVSACYELQTYGEALMPRSFEGYWGRYLTLQAWPTADQASDLVPLLRIAEGRAPQRPGEVVLSRDLKGATVENGQWLYDSLPTNGRDDDAPRVDWEGPIDLGTELDIALGQRMFRDDIIGRDRALTPSNSLYTDSGPGGDTISEWLSDVGPIDSYSVVGFYDADGEYMPEIWSNNAGYLGFVQRGSLAPRSTDYIISTDLDSRGAIEELASQYSDSPHGIETDWLLGDTIVELHDALLGYQGMVDDSAIWGTLYSLAAILSCVVAAASISLIYNSFAIAVTERTRQFGLLASLGASKRQLRRSVYFEAAVLAAIGIPCGLAIGLAATSAVFHVAGEGVGMLIDQYAFGQAGVSNIVISPAVLAVSALLALATVFVSAAVPAFRASRVPAIDAIRQNRDVRPSRRDRARARRRARGKGPLDSVLLKSLGVPALIAHRNLSRAGSKGRVAVASLGISVALIIISGSISHYLGYLAGATESTGSDVEVSLVRVLTDGETTRDGVAAIDAAYRSLAEVKGATGEGYVIGIPLYGSLEPEMLKKGAIGDGRDPAEGGVGAQGTAYVPMHLCFIDNASWNKLLEDNGLDSERFHDSERPLAIALNGTRSSAGEKIAVHSPFKRTGTATLFTRMAEREGAAFTSVTVDAQGLPQAEYELYQNPGEVDVDEEGNAEELIESVPLDEALLDTYALPVGAIVEEAPASLLGFGSSWPTLVLPVSALPALAEGSESVEPGAYSGPMGTPFAFQANPGSYDNSMSAFLSFGVGDARATGARMRAVIESELTGGEWYRTWLSNNAEDIRANRVMYETVQLFINCFIAVTGTIAVANVFNTLANSIMLRRREFAMLKSVGMGGRAFWRMISLECLSYAWRGLALGLALGAGVTYLIFRAMSIGFEGLAFSLPIAWVVGAVGAVGAVLALSTIYALRKAHANSIVATLREDSI